MTSQEFVLDDQRASVVVRPTSCDDATKSLEELRGHYSGVVPWGGGTAVQQGNLLSSQRWAAISTAHLEGVVEYAADDMVITAYAGTTLGAVQRVLAAHRQFLPFDLPDECTLGGIVARNGFGALRLQFGLPRDRLLAVDVLLATGETVKSGARVVKNVAGYDMCKLFAGSRGTLGLILRVTFKTVPISATRCTVQFRAQDVTTAVQCGMEIHQRHLAPAGMVATSRPSMLFAHLLGSAQSVAWQQKQLTEVALNYGLDTPATIPEMELSPLFGSCDEQLGVRLATLPSAQADIVANLPACLPVPPSAVRCLPGIGITELDWALPLEVPVILQTNKILREQLKPGESLFWTNAPRAAKLALECVWGCGPPGADLHCGIKRALDPERLFAPGRFAGGI